MPSINDVQIDQRFSFEVYPASIIGNNFKDVKLDGIISARSATTFGVDIVSLHAQVYPTLPPGTPNDPFKYSWVRVTYPNGETVTLGVPWIRPESIVVSAGGRVTIMFENKSQSDVDRMLLALSSNGFRPDDVQVAS